MHKLRTMRVGAGDAGVITGRADARIFPVGSLLRRFKIDEIPQLGDIVAGHMAFVGPRPEAPQVVRDDFKPWMTETLVCPPGIVGLGSLGYYLEEGEIPSDPTAARQHYAEVLLPRKLARDLVFVRNRTVRYQVQIVIRSLASIVGVTSLFARQQAWEFNEAERILREVSSG